MANNEPLPQIIHFEVLNNTNEELTFSSVLERQDWQPIKAEIFSGGYTHKTHWLKLTLNAPPHKALLLTIILTMLDDVRLYIPDKLVNPEAHIKPSATEILGWSFFQQGDLFPFNQREVNWRGFSFALRIPDTKSHTVYLRIVSTSTHLVFPQLWTITQFATYQQNEMLLCGVVMGIMLVFLTLAILAYLLIRETLQKYYLALMVFSIFYFLVFNGFLTQWILRDYPKIASDAMGFIVGLLMIPTFGFHREILFGNIPQSLRYRQLSVFMVLSFIISSSVLFGYYHLIIGTFNVLLFLSTVIHLLIIVWMRFKKQLTTDIFYLYSFIFISNLIAMVGFLGVNTLSWHCIYGTQIGTLTNALLLLVITLKETYKTINSHQQATSLAEFQANASQSQRYWMAMLTHEIKTPLSVISASCQSMELLNIETAIQTRLHKIKRNVMRIDNLVKHFLGNDEVPARLQHLQRTKIDIQKWLLAQLNLFDEVAQKRWHVNAKAHFFVFVDPTLLAIALNNLLTNSLKYSMQNTVIEIGITQHKHQHKNGVLLFIKDYGIPITDEKRQHLFVRFQLNEYQGNGVGLWACQEIARAHGGDVWLDDSRTDGNTFNIWLPMKNEEFNVQLSHCFN